MKQTSKKRITITLDEEDVSTLDYLVRESSTFDSKGKEIYCTRSKLVASLIKLYYRKHNEGIDIWK